MSIISQSAIGAETPDCPEPPRAAGEPNAHLRSTKLHVGGAGRGGGSPRSGQETRRRAELREPMGQDAGVRRDVAATPPQAAAARTRKDASPVSEPQVTLTVGPKPAPLFEAERARGMTNETNNPLACPAGSGWLPVMPRLPEARSAPPIVRNYRRPRVDGRSWTSTSTSTRPWPLSPRHFRPLARRRARAGSRCDRPRALPRRGARGTRRRPA